MIIYFRICERQETNGLGTRWGRKNKIEIMKKCWLSLQPGITAEDNIILINDHCSDSLVQWLTANTKATVIDSKVPDHNGNPAVSFIHCAEVLNKETRASPDEIHYICEDDYLHLPNAIIMAKHLFNHNGWKGFCVLYDYPDRYHLDRSKQCEIFINEHSHWRSVPSSTGCLMATGSIWQQWMTIFTQSAKNNSDTFTWHAFANTPCICPIPGVASHMTEGLLTPFINWGQLWDKIEVKE